MSRSYKQITLTDRRRLHHLVAANVPINEMARQLGWGPAERENNPGHGMPDDVAIALRLKGFLRGTGPHARATVRRQLTS